MGRNSPSDAPGGGFDLLFQAGAPEGGQEEVAKAVGVAGVEVGGGEVEAEVAWEMEEAIDQGRAIEATDFLDEGFIEF